MARVPCPIAPRAWSLAEDALLLREWRQAETEEKHAIARRIGRTYGSCSARHSSLINKRVVSGQRQPRVPEGAAGLANAQAVAPRVNFGTRCPWCEAPPHDPACRHGWDGETSARQRRDMRATVQAELVR